MGAPGNTENGRRQGGSNGQEGSQLMGAPGNTENGRRQGGANDQEGSRLMGAPGNTENGRRQGSANGQEGSRLMGASGYTAKERRSANQVWNTAREYGYEPMFLARRTDGTPDFYMNSIVGLVHKYYGEKRVRRLFAAWAGDVGQSRLDDLVWLYLEQAAYILEMPDRPALPELRRRHAEEFFAQQHHLSRQEWMAKNQLVAAMQEARWSRVLGRRLPVLTPRERELMKALEPEQAPEPERLEETVLEILKRYLLFDGQVRKKTEFRLHMDGLLASLMTKIMPVQLVKTDRVTVERSSAADEPGNGGLLQDTRRAQITLSRQEMRDRDYIESCFGRSLYGQRELQRAERELCTDVHFGCHLWFTDGTPAPGKKPSPPARQLAGQAELQAERNHIYYEKNMDLHRSMERRLTGQIRNCLMVHQDPDAMTARSGRMDTAHVWRAPLLEDNRVFRRSEEEHYPYFSVELLLDASASRLYCQETIAAQGVILAKSLLGSGIPVRVSSFSSLRGYTVLQILKDYGERQTQNIFRYFASGWNRDGLALRAVGELMEAMPGPVPRYLLILLTDAAPNDSHRISPSPENPFGHDYGGAAGVMDAAANVRTLRRKGIHTAAVFMGSDGAEVSAKTIYGRSLARIRGMDQLAQAAGRLIQEEIRGLDEIS